MSSPAVASATGPGVASTVAASRPERRILYVEQNIDGTTGGSYRSLLFLLRGLDKSYSKTVLFYREHELLDAYRKAGCRTMLVSMPRALDFTSPLRSLGIAGRLLRPFALIAQKGLNFFWMSVRLIARDMALLKRERIDVLHLNNGVQVGAEFLIAAKLMGIKVIISQRGIDPVPRWSGWLAQRADHVICVSEAARQFLIDHGLSPNRCTAVHNGINLEALRGQIERDSAAVRASIGLSPDDMVVGLAGMIRPWKGQLVLVKAMNRLRSKYPHLRAIIMGGVSDRNPEDVAYLAEIRAMIRDQSLEKNVMLLEYQANAPEFLQTFDIMVHTAVDPEPFSRVVIEGMALERAIVASATGGTPEAIDDGVSGYLVPANDDAALADRIDFLLQHPDKRKELGRGALEKVQRRFLIQGHIDRTCAIYDRVLKGSAA